MVEEDSGEPLDIHEVLVEVGLNDGDVQWYDDDAVETLLGQHLDRRVLTRNSLGKGSRYSGGGKAKRQLDSTDSTDNRSDAG